MLNQTQKIIGLSHMTWAWGLLMAITILAWKLGTLDQSLAALGVIVTACFKVWIIAHQFMELKIAPAPLRLGFLLWVIGIGAVLIYLIS